MVATDGFEEVEQLMYIRTLIDFFEAACRVMDYTAPSRGCVPCPARYGVTINPALRAFVTSTAYFIGLPPSHRYGFYRTLVNIN